MTKTAFHFRHVELTGSYCSVCENGSVKKKISSD